MEIKDVVAKKNQFLEMEKKVKREIRVQSFPLWILNIFALSLLGAFSFASVGFEPSQLIELSFWTPILIKIIANDMVYFSTYTSEISVSRKKSEELNRIEKDIASSLSGKDMRNITKFLTYKNIEIKTEAWKNKIQRKIARLDHWSRVKDISIWENGTELQKQKNLYCRKKQKLLRLITPEYISQNISSIKVKCIQYTYAMVLSGIISKNSAKALEQTPQKDVVKGAFMKNISRLMIIILTSALAFDFLKIGMQAIIDFFSNMFVLVSMWSSAKNSAKAFVNDVMVAQSYERIELLSEYFKWNKGEKEEEICQQNQVVEESKSNSIPKQDNMLKVENQ